MHPPVEKTGLAFGVGIPDDVGNFDVDAIVPLTTTAYDAPNATHGIAMGGKVISMRACNNRSPYYISHHAQCARNKVACSTINLSLVYYCECRSGSRART